MRCLLLSLFLLGCSGVAATTAAHAAPFIGGGDSGSLRPLHGDHPAVRLVSEKIKIGFIQFSSFDVIVDSVLRNEGPSRKVSMGIPENDSAVLRNQLDVADRGLEDLCFAVDGRTVRFQRQIVQRQRVEWPAYNALSVIEVPFKKRQTRHIRVRYRSYLRGHCALWMTYFMGAHQWRGQVTHTSVMMVGGGDLYYDKSNDPGVVAPTLPLRTRGTRSHFQWNNWRPQGAFLIA